MISIDRRIGSGHLLPLLEARRIPAVLASLAYGDVMWEGRGPEERPIPIGVEIKTWPDLLNSLTTGRLMGHQLPGLLANYEHVWLIVQGLYRLDDEGIISVRVGRGWRPLSLAGRQLLWRDVGGLLATLEVCAGLHIRQTDSATHTARVIGGLYHWWTGKAFDQHRSHLGFHDVPDPHIRLTTPPLVVRMAKELDGVGWEKAHALGRHLSSPRALFDADEQALRVIPGIGKTLAARIVAALGGPNGATPPHHSAEGL